MSNENKKCGYFDEIVTGSNSLLVLLGTISAMDGSNSSKKHFIAYLLNLTSRYRVAAALSPVRLPLFPFTSYNSTLDSHDLISLINDLSIELSPCGCKPVTRPKRYGALNLGLSGVAPLI